ncbi:ribonuclease P protein component [Roseovarius autotrophicus]|uniref:ribonuclease P protein component n=1 Tax=Roseovarius autotrophicus TaxID=2824121 RepID=UPI001B3779DE|nr:ribonuclease P protein component [Roseovarius autotrophicus]
MISTPPEAPDCKAGITPPAVSACVPRIEVMRARADFLATARGLRQGTGTMMVQGRDRGDGNPLIRVGFTCSKKVGNAVTRNRAKRRLRAIARELLPDGGQPGWDYVLIGRADATALRPFDDLRRDLAHALRCLGQRP